jgi:hypothetical protein
MLLAATTVALACGIGVQTHLAIGAACGAIFDAFIILLPDVRDPYWERILWACLAIAIALLLWAP